jgi:hypothetical protein
MYFSPPAFLNVPYNCSTAKFQVSEILFVIHELFHLSSLAETRGHLSVPNAVAKHTNMSEATDFLFRFIAEGGWEAEARALNPCPCDLITVTEHVTEIKLCVPFVVSLVFVDAHGTATSREE